MKNYYLSYVQNIIRLLSKNCTIIGPIFLFMISFSGSITHAGPSHYDFTFLLKQSHPFDLVLSSPKPKNHKSSSRAVAQTRKLETYEEKANRWLSERGSTLVKLIGISKSENKILKAETHINSTPNSSDQKNESRFQFGLGYFDVTDNDTSAEVRAEVHGERFANRVRPLVGFMATSDEALYGYLGFVVDIPIMKNVFLSPSFAPGVYLKNSGKKLGSLVEFRSMAEISYKLQSGSRVGLAVYHLSNAGLTQYNPGVEVVTLCYTLPFEQLYMF